MPDEPSEYALGRLSMFVDEFNAAQVRQNAVTGWDDLPQQWRTSISQAFTKTVDKIQDELY